jgi:PAS domain S-box-containing protein
MTPADIHQALAARFGNVGFWDWDLATNATVYSDEWKSQLGYAPEEIKADYREWESRLHPDDRTRAIARIRTYLAGDTRDYEVEFRLRHKDGSYRWIFARGEAIRDAGVA